MITWDYNLRELYNRYGDFIITLGNVLEYNETIEKLISEKIELYPALFHKDIGHISIFKFNDKIVAAEDRDERIPTLIPFEQLTKFHSERIIIYYTERNETFTIVKITGLVSFDAIPRFIQNIISDKLHLFKYSNGFRIMQSARNILNVDLDREISEKDFKKIINLTKEAGKIFNKAIRKYNEIKLDVNKVYQVEI